ncbi:MAG: preprotein translocase subunit SecG [Inhella sp.]|jgi:preprotein translocase subunit SecG
MQFLMNLVIALQLLSALAIIVLVLLQQGKGADMGAAFGGGASGTLFGATGSANALSRATAILATTFFACTLALAHFATNRPVAASEGLLDGKPASAASAPASAAPISGAGAIPGAAPASAASAP